MQTFSNDEITLIVYEYNNSVIVLKNDSESLNVFALSKEYLQILYELIGKELMRK